MFNFLRAFSTESSLRHESFRLCDPPNDNLRGWSNSSTTMVRFSSRTHPPRNPGPRSCGDEDEAARFRVRCFGEEASNFSGWVWDRIRGWVVVSDDSVTLPDEFLLFVKNFSMTDPMSSGSTATWLATSHDTMFGCKLFVRRFRELPEDGQVKDVGGGGAVACKANVEGYHNLYLVKQFSSDSLRLLLTSESVFPAEHLRLPPPVPDTDPWIDLRRRSSSAESSASTEAFPDNIISRSLNTKKFRLLSK